MEKVKVIQEYRDKNTKFLMKVGMETEYEKERAQELISKGFVEAIVQEVEPEKEDTEKVEEASNEVKTKKTPQKRGKK